jgi:hypothetical protein
MGSSIGTTVADQANGTTVPTTAFLNGPAAIILDSNNNLYIADDYNNRAEFWAQGVSSGVTVAGSGKTEKNNFIFAYHILTMVI